MTDLPSSSDDGAQALDERRRGHKLLVAAATAVLLALGLSILVSLWWRRGGPRNVITELAEQGAVRLADAVVDEVLGAP